ncbi:hypothetical protein [Cellulophaga sp. BC115SP]|uniref:hypothetical protein n=1 Tax=Cellulophaga sp. BC115SP TaxID=2683263 RepID=UPI0014122470|nr:hypothetical protein [Cellulophaga sp. BC115SP]NBB31869.1 hypothetical protein [Cellulophaga sp. BC115SP]
MRALLFGIQDTEAKDVKIDAVWKYLGSKAQEHQATFPITGAQLHEIFSGTSQERCDEVASIINKYSDKFEINTPLRMAHFLGQIGTETVGLKKLQESTCYSSKDRIKEVFGKIKYCDLFEGYESDLTECDSDETPKACNPALKKITSDLVVKDKYVCSSNLFDYTYSYRMGNGPASTKDGSTFLGKGFVHLTGKGQYQTITSLWNSDSENANNKMEFDGRDIDLLTTNLDVAMKASMYFWRNSKKVIINNVKKIGDGNSFADSDDQIYLNQFVNGGQNGAESRQGIKEQALLILNK